MSGYVDHAWRHAPKALGGTDPIAVAASSGVPTFAAWKDTWTPASSPDILDSITHYSSSDATVFDLNSGLPRILQSGFYVVVMFATVSFDGVPGADEAAKFDVAFAGDIGYSLEPPAVFPTPFTPMTTLEFPTGTSDSYEVSGQRMRPISVTAGTTYPLEIHPTAWVTSVGDFIFDWVGLWGYRLSDALGGIVSD